MLFGTGDCRQATPPPHGVANTIIAILQSLGSYDHCLSPQTTIAYHSLLREMVILLGTYGASRGSSTTNVVLRMCTYLVGCMSCALEIFYTRVLVYRRLYIKVLAHVRERNNTTSTIITTLRPVYFLTSRLKQSIFSLVRS
jgi:hypothetical protein